MLEEARRKAPNARFVHGDAFDLPFEDHAFDRLLTSFFYGHLELEDRMRFLSESRRVASELVVVDASRERSDVDEELQQRTLNDGSEWHVYKRYFRPEVLVDELGGGEVLHAGRWFV